MRILGIDPGLRLTGYGLIDASGGGETPALVEAGVIRLVSGSKAPPVESRLVELDREFDGLLKRLTPDAVTVEAVFSHSRHPATSILMGHARGVLLCAAARRGLPITELKPAEVKKGMAGYGQATKSQMQSAVAAMFGLAEPPSPPDIADAIAVAVGGHRRMMVEAALDS